MSHLRIWRSKGTIYFAGQLPIDGLLAQRVREGTYRMPRTLSQMQALAQAIASTAPTAPYANPFGDAQDE